jgi:hypothetical protein
MAHKLDADVDVIGLKVEEVEAAAGFFGVRLAGEVDELDEGATDLVGKKVSACPSLCRKGRSHTSTAIWLTTAVWFGRRISLVS